ncbi:hypothetical protein LJB98_05775 [Bacteroidales bacterium OttesenSCG-928-M11]|nr:hypothetical protein [Bacteroidales bacterium OttesenSCG-928-M11]
MEENVLQISGGNTFGLLENEVLYIEKEYNPVLNDMLSRSSEYKDLFKKNGYKFIYIPELISTWANNIELLNEVLSYHYPDNNLKLENTKEYDLSNITTSDYTKAFLKAFSYDLTANTTGGLLINIRDDIKSYPLSATSSIALVEEINSIIKDSKDYREYLINHESFALSVEYDDGEEIKYEANKIIDEIRERIELLKRDGHERLLLKLILDEFKGRKKSHLRTELNYFTECEKHLEEYKNYHQKIRLSSIESFESVYLNKTISSLLISEDFRIFLPDYNNLEIEMRPLPKTVFFFFLRHPEGILFKELSKAWYKEELHSIYKQLSPREDHEAMKKSIDDICNPADNSIHEKCSRIKEAFLRHISDDIAREYYITGGRGMPKRITLDRKKIVRKATFDYDNSTHVHFDPDEEPF